MTDWMDRAFCAEVGADLWFPPSGHMGLDAKRACRTMCPVRAECLAHALEIRPSEGIWAGYTARGLRRLREGGDRAARNAEIVRLSELGVRAEDIAERVRVTDRTVWRVLRQARKEVAA